MITVENFDNMTHKDAKDMMGKLDKIFAMLKAINENLIIMNKHELNLSTDELSRTKKSVETISRISKNREMSKFDYMKACEKLKELGVGGDFEEVSK